MPGRSGGIRSPLIPLEGLHDELVEEVTALVDALLDQEVGDVGVDLNGCGGDDRTAPDMGSHQHVARLRQRGDLLARRDAAAASQIGLGKGTGALGEQVLELDRE